MKHKLMLRAALGIMSPSDTAPSGMTFVPLAWCEDTPKNVAAVANQLTIGHESLWVKHADGGFEQLDDDHTTAPHTVDVNDPPMLSPD